MIEKEFENETNMARKLPEYNYKSSLKKEEAGIYRRIGLVATLTLIIVIILAIWGSSAINAMGTFISGFNKNNTSSNSQTNEFLVSPHLDVLPIATNSALLDIKGWATPKQEIQLTVNDTLVGKLQSKDDGTFIFPAVNLRNGTNQISAVIIDNSSKTSQPTTTTISYNKTPPKIQVDQPVNNLLVGAGISQVEVRGKTDQGATVSVNDNQIVVNADSSFDTFVPLQPGNNSFKITATDSAGNQTTIQRIVTSQNPPTPPPAP